MNDQYRQVKSIILVLFLICCMWGGREARAEAGVLLSRGQTVYVPIYSHIYSGDKERVFYLTAILSIRNTDPEHAIHINAVNYIDSEGKLVERYLKSPVQLDPMASVRYVVKQSDKAGGSGANFIVTWESNAEVNPPLIESVMIGTQGQQGISFTSRGQVIGGGKK